MSSVELAAEQREAAASRAESRSAEREKHVETLAQPGGLLRADTLERVAKRADRLSRYYAGEELPSHADEAPSASPEEVLAVACERAVEVLGGGVADDGLIEAGPTPEVVLERIINTRDFVDVRYLEAGVAAGRAVGRVHMRNASGRLVGYGTGSLVSSRLLLTNHHVVPTAEAAAASAVEFNYQVGLDGQPLPARIFRFDPQTFFLADRAKDFALVAMRASQTALVEFGFNRLIEAEGKVIIGEFVTIVQHPGGERKQVALRENRIVDLFDAYLHYEADTEPGSSGSPVFNDQWEVVGLHHASVRARDRDGYLNEGIRVSRLLRFIREQRLSQAMRALADQLFQEEAIVSRRPPAASPLARALSSEPPDLTDDTDAELPTADDGAVRLTVPLEITLRLGSNNPSSLGRAAPVDDSRADVGPPFDDLDSEEAISIDPNYASRRGYNPAFLGSGARRIRLPRLTDEMAALAAVNSKATSGPRYVLPYHHYSVVMNRVRRLAFLTAVNIDGRVSYRPKRERDRWFRDPRIPAESQTDEWVYDDNDLDRGHLVRRLDPAWGSSAALAKVANDDTFHFTNCTPQHEDFNQNRTTWAGLEDYILDNADNRDLKVSVFTGPVFADDDDAYRGVKLPRQFWKVVAMVKTNGELSATAYLLSQEGLLQQGLEAAEEFSYGAYKTFQVPVRRVEELTGLSFSALAAADPLAGIEATAEAREITSEADLTL